MNADLKAFVNKNYPISKSDLFAVFMESTLAMTVKSGRMGMVNQHSWMFLSSYEKLRIQLLNDHGIENMLHLGPRAFDDVSGEVVQSTAFVMQREGSDEAGTYHRLVDGPDGDQTQVVPPGLPRLLQHPPIQFLQNSRKPDCLLGL